MAIFVLAGVLDPGRADSNGEVAADLLVVEVSLIWLPTEAVAAGFDLNELGRDVGVVIIVGSRLVAIVWSTIASSSPALEQPASNADPQSSENGRFVVDTTVFNTH